MKYYEVIAKIGDEKLKYLVEAKSTAGAEKKLLSDTPTAEILSIKVTKIVEVI